MNPNRLYFIDAVRAFAILMMLQGHFISTLLDPIYNDNTNTIYNIWYYFRGITAPVFFTISGLVFIYLILKAKAKGCDKARIKKGLERGLMLIAIGYLLRIPFLGWLYGSFNTYFLIIDVLQCIGLSLILLIVLYILSLKKDRILSVVLLVSGILCFLYEPIYKDLNFNWLPELLANYLTKANGSIFTILPWFGFVAFGGFLATIFFRHVNKKRFRLITSILFFIIGYLLITCSSWALMKLYYLTDVEIFKASAYYNYLFTRFGNVLLLFGVFYSLENFLKQSIISKIGEKTLSIYFIHFVIIFGSFTGVGLKHFFYQNLTPIEAVIGAILFVVVVCFISFYYVKTNAFIYKQIRKLYFKLKR
ncbi:heparan-alpha-glucosaminide N-acetyltransferase domain-containing protein [uncultured Lacinutrix sp.]|uniref:heparan-alpha-glucosaminide N-acetyltransferase domain-containing protein n=1 Tax=uncultured Lacinutrix sp. TaxID=574032 RepID=UPI0026106D2B|nr:heparan-alpha-glucosaminide N-acetyltransferase domain-containing protein [uncultured Lacinutrix sp.]